MMMQRSSPLEFSNGLYRRITPYLTISTKPCKIKVRALEYWSAMWGLVEVILGLSSYHCLNMMVLRMKMELNNIMANGIYEAWNISFRTVWNIWNFPKQLYLGFKMVFLSILFLILLS